MLSRQIVRRLSSLAEPLPKFAGGKYPVPNTPQYKKLMEKQTFFTRDDGLMVWQKTSNDVILYRLSTILVTVASVLTLAGLWKLASPPKNN